MQAIWHPKDTDSDGCPITIGHLEKTESGWVASTNPEFTGEIEPTERAFLHYHSARAWLMNMYKTLNQKVIPQS